MREQADKEMRKTQAGSKSHKFAVQERFEDNSLKGVYRFVAAMME